MTINTSGLGGGGSPIRSVQRGILFPQPQSTVNVNISAIDVNKSFVNVSSANGLSQASSNAAIAVSAAASIVNTTLIKVETGRRVDGATSNFPPIVYWEVIEYV